MGLPERPLYLRRLASGIEAGVVGGLAMLAVLTSGALLRGNVWWAPCNLLGSTFFGLRAFRTGTGWATLSGFAFHIVIAGVVGACFALVCGEITAPRRLLLLGAMAGVLWHYLADAVFWPWVNPLVPLYASRPDTLLAHAVFGLCLGRMGRPEPAESAGPPPLPVLEAPPLPIEPAGTPEPPRVEAPPPPIERTGAPELPAAASDEDKVE
jgi:hypothetical protein